MSVQQCSLFPKNHNYEHHISNNGIDVANIINNGCQGTTYFHCFHIIKKRKGP